MRIQIKGPNAAAVAAELQRYCDAAGLSNETVREDETVTRDPIAVAGLVVGIVGLAISLPGSIKSILDIKDRKQATMKDKLAQQAAIDALKARVEALQAEHPDTRITPVRAAGELWQWR